MNPDDDIVVAKVVLLYFVSNMLLANNDMVYLDSFYLNLIEDLDKFNEYLWEKVFWEYFSHCIHHAMENEVSRSMTRKRGGIINVFRWALSL